MYNEEFYKAAIDAENYFGVPLYLDIVFSDELNEYFDYDYSPDDDLVKIKIEVDEGEALLTIANINSPDLDYELNDTMLNYVKLNKN